MNVIRVLRTVAVAAACLCATLPRTLTAQVLEGKLTWPSGESVVGARTTILNEDFQPVEAGVSDDSGRYRLLAPAPGDYVLVVDVEGYASQMSDFVSVAAGSTVTLDVVVEARGTEDHFLAPGDTMGDADLLAAGIAEACRSEFFPSMHGIVFGTVRDTDTESIIPGAAVVLQWERSSRVVLEISSKIEATADDAGIYLICNAPGEEDLTLKATAHDAEGLEMTQRLRVGTMRRVDLEIPLYDADEPGRVWGLVKDQASGQLLSGVQVQIQDTDLRVESDAGGTFRMPEVPWGVHNMVFEHPSYGRQEQTITIIGGRSFMVEVHLPPAPIEMPPLVVSVRRRRWFGDMEGLQARIDRGEGYILTRERIDEQNPRNLADVLRTVPGVRVRQSGGSVSGTITVQMRGAQSIMGQACAPVVWVDGQKWRNANEAYSTLMGFELEVVEVYRGAAEVPAEFLDSSASCGVLVVWTRRGRTFGR